MTGQLAKGLYTYRDMGKKKNQDSYDNALQRIAKEVDAQTGELDLSNLHLSSLPPELSVLKKLARLYLGGNELTELPREIGSLTELKLLTLDNNRLTSLPPEIGFLTKLTDLRLAHSQVTALPPEIGKLTALTELGLHDNRLESLPPEIGALTSLKILWLGANRLTALPAEIGSLAALEELYLQDNQLTSVPSEIGSLTALTFLVLRNNQLSALPPEIGLLRSLNGLYIPGNDLSSLPSELRNLEHMDVLVLHRNPRLGLSPSLLGPDPGSERVVGYFPSASSILDAYFGRQSADARPLNEVKLVLVGRGGAGKTSLVRALRGQPFRANEGSTPGIALSDLTLESCPGGDVTAHVWDFAGQVITHALHQFFFSVRSVYVLALTGRENSEREDAEYWLRLIKAFGTEEDGQCAPVIVALNKWDLKGCRPKIDRGALKERYPFIQEFVEVDCKKPRGIGKLTKALKLAVKELKWVREPFRGLWDDVRRELTSSRKTAAYLSYDEFRRVCRSHGIDNESEQDSLSEILHNLGSALNYRNDPRLHEATVLKPQWLTKNVYTLVRKAEGQAGVLRRADIDAALAKVTEPKMRDYLVRLMERFEIAYRSRTVSPATWLVPQALPDIQPKGAEEFAKIDDATRLRFTYEALPEGLVARAIVRLHEFVEEVRGKKRQWASGAILARDGARALLRTEPERRLTVTVDGPIDARRQLAGLCQSELRDIHSEIPGLDPDEETQVDGEWVRTATLEADEISHTKTGVATSHGTTTIDPADANNAFSKKAARVDDIWKPTAFICYSKSNINQRKQLESQLKILKNEGLLARHWHDRMIDAGDGWHPRIQRELSDADLILVLISADSLSTDYITEIEIPKAMELHDAGSAIVIPIILQACRWDKTRLGSLQAIPEKGVPIARWRRPADAWKSVADELAKVCETLLGSDGAGRRVHDRKR
jgi:internalin A